MICYFQKGLKPSIKVKMEQQNRESVNFEKIVQKAVNAEAKAGLRSTILVRDSNIYCSQSHCPFNNIVSKIQTKETIAKDFSRSEKPKIKDPKLVFLCDNIANPAKKEYKQKRLKCQQKYIRKSKKILAIGDNIIDATKKKKKAWYQ